MRHPLHTPLSVPFLLTLVLSLPSPAAAVPIFNATVNGTGIQEVQILRRPSDGGAALRITSNPRTALTFQNYPATFGTMPDTWMLALTVPNRNTPDYEPWLNTLAECERAALLAQAQGAKYEFRIWANMNSTTPTQPVVNTTLSITDLRVDSSVMTVVCIARRVN